MPNNRIYITISDETNTGVQSSGESLTSQEAQRKLTPSTPGGTANKSKSKGTAIAAMVAHRSFSYVTSNVGKWTGNNQRQQRVNNAMQAASIVGLALINPYVAIASVGLSIATTAIDEAYDRKWSAKTAANAQARAGYSSTDEVVGRRH